MEIGRKEKANLKVLKLLDNRGKGNAVKLGMLCAAGEFVIFADADNATAAKSFDELEVQMAKIAYRGYGAVFGSRKHMREDIQKEVRAN